MPATVVSSALSWSAYLAASLALIVLLSPGTSAVLIGAQVSAGSRILEGVTELVDGLRPGVNLTLRYGQPAFQARIFTQGHTLAFLSPAFSGSEQCRWALPNATLFPGVKYSVWLAGGSVRFSRDG
jgi:hypothetical protein